MCQMGVFGGGGGVVCKFDQEELRTPKREKCVCEWRGADTVSGELSPEFRMIGRLSYLFQGLVAT